MRFSDTRALLLPREGVHVQWRIEPETTDIDTVELELARSESPRGPWVTLQVLDPMTRFSFTDRTAPWRPKNAELYYRLTAVERDTGDAVTDCPAFGFQGALPLDALEIIRQHNLLLNGVNGHTAKTGIRVTVYKRRNFGSPCRVCRDVVTDQVVNSQCRECVGTGFAGGGYYAPILIGANLQPSPAALQITNLGAIEDNETVAFITNFPVMYPGDMIVEPDEKHWRVVQVDVTERKRVVVHQMLRLRQLDHNDVEYEVLRHLDNQELS